MKKVTIVNEISSITDLKSFHELFCKIDQLGLNKS